MALGFYGWRNNYGIPTPELGFTETLAKIVGAPLDRDTKGSQLGLSPTDYQRNIVNPVQQSQALYNSGTRSGRSSGSQILGTSTNNLSYQNPQQPTTQQVAPNPFDEEQARRNLINEVDSVYGDTDRILNEHEASARAGKQNFLEQFTKQIDAEVPLLDAAYSEGKARNYQQREEEQNRLENVLASARRMYNELSQGVRQRFGGVNSAGDFANAFYGREFQRNSSNIHSDSATNMRSLENDFNKIEGNYQAQKLSLEQRKQGLLAQAQTEFQKKLDHINEQRFQASQNKAALKLQALQDLRTNIMSIRANFQAQDDALMDQLNSAKLQIAANIQAYRAEMGQPVNLHDLHNAVYTPIGQGRSYSPSQDITGYYSPRSREEDFLRRIYGQA